MEGRSVELLFAPWRLAYVTSRDDAAGCVLCRARDGQDGADRLVVHVGESCFVVMNLYPYNARPRDGDPEAAHRHAGRGDGRRSSPR